MSFPNTITAQQAYKMLGNSPLWETLTHCHEILALHQIPHVLAGGVAVALCGYQRNTIGIDFIVNQSDAPRIKAGLLQAGYLWDQQHIQFISPQKIPVQFLYSGDRAGRDAEFYLPDPANSMVYTIIENIPVLTLPKLIETKLASGLGDMRRTHKDFADVVELILIHQLNKFFAAKLHKSLRKVFKELIDRVD